MDGKMIARIGAVVFVGIAITATVIEFTRKPEEPQSHALVRERADTGALRQLLKDCRDQGEAATRDPACLDLWAENRDRFLGRSVQPRSATAPQAPTTLFPAGDPTRKESVPAAEKSAPGSQPVPALPEVR